MTQPLFQNLKNKPYGGASFILDKDLLSELDYVFPINQWLLDSEISQQFLDFYRDWILSTTNNTVKGLELFPYAVQTHATTEGFDKFYMAHNQRRFRCFRGEYMYHQVTWRNSWPNWKFIEDETLDSNDAVVISFPFSDTGGKHKCLDKVLERCSELNIPVLVDCAYFGICGDLDFDFTHPCIHTITFALSKTFPLSHARVGLRFTRQDDDDPAFVTQKTNYTNRVASGLGLHFMKKYSPDYIYNAYRSTQLDFCNQLNVLPSDCVMFGIGDLRWHEYNRGTKTNRLSFHKYLHTGTLPKN